jgi:hypothetical protein
MLWRLQLLLLHSIKKEKGGRLSICQLMISSKTKHVAPEWQFPMAMMGFILTSMELENQRYVIVSKYYMVGCHKEVCR